ncbi:neuropeptide CCHamide-1-like isoform X2 [Adelges cooleyi]|uniref:neuropeptide CCHamide-1-like isoform X2 n=1 Tax=Adelges cooleyi TaxID=133065 RepID=UPI00217FFB94|nr:neuropeptide CCHamide-1-like isoform X2 [Adelges cooleyi]
MHQYFVKISIFLLIVCSVDDSESKQGACLSYGHSCWGAHGKRNTNVPNYPNDWFLYRMSLLRKNDNRDATMELNQQSDDGDVPNYFNILKTYIQRSAKKTNNEDIDGPWNAQRGQPKNRYVETFAMDPENDYRLIVNNN